MRSAALRLVVVAQCAWAAACLPSYGRVSPAGLDASCLDLPVGLEAGLGYGFEDGPAAFESDVLWLRPDAPRERELGSAWCGTVGGPVYVAAPDPARATTPGDSLVVLSWNMAVGGGDLGSLVETELGVPCGGTVRDAASRAARPFVLLVQEAHRESRRLPAAPASALIPPTIDPEEASPLDIVELAAACGLSLVYVPSMRNGPDSGARPHEDKGNAVLSNLPLARPVAVDLPFETYRRVAVGAEIDVGDARLRVVSVHLDVSAMPFRLLLGGNQTRARQASGLIDALNAMDADRLADAGTLVGGDLNSWSPWETALRLMRRAFPDSPPHDGVTTRGVFPADHVFFRSDTDYLHAADYRVLRNSYGSDHRGRALLLIRGEPQRSLE